MDSDFSNGGACSDVTFTVEAIAARCALTATGASEAQAASNTFGMVLNNSPRGGYHWFLRAGWFLGSGRITLRAYFWIIGRIRIHISCSSRGMSLVHL